MLNLVLIHGIPPNFRCGTHLYIPSYAIGLVPSLSGHAIAYRWRSLPRVRRDRASSLQGSSSNGFCLCIIMEQLMCAPLFSNPLSECSLPARCQPPGNCISYTQWLTTSNLPNVTSSIFPLAFSSQLYHSRTKEIMFKLTTLFL